MTASEREAVADLQRKIDRERRLAECPCVRSLLVILSKGLGQLSSASCTEPETREEGRE